MKSLAPLADDTRLRIVEVLAERDRTVSEIVDLFHISQPAISRHLRILREAGYVSVASDGTRRIYQLDPSVLEAIAAWAQRWHSAWHARFDALGKHLDDTAAKRRPGGGKNVRTKGATRHVR